MAAVTTTAAKEEVRMFVVCMAGSKEMSKQDKNDSVIVSPLETGGHVDEHVW